MSNRHVIGQLIADAAELALGYSERLLVGITADQFARLANVSGTVIQSNHPAFVFGHLSLYPSRVVEQLGQDASAITPSDDYSDLFGPKAQCVDDPQGTIYPPMDEVVAKYFAHHRRAIEVVKQADDSLFAEINPVEAARAKFGTLGSAHAFYLGGHLMLHIGQLSAWRRMIGMPPA